MYTTNTATPNIPTTYTNLRSECEALLETAKELESFAYTTPAFSSDPKFDQLKKQFREKFQSLASLQAAL
jgi:hypothetical protein